MTVTLQNTKNRLLNLTCINGFHLVFGPYETKTISKEIFEDFKGRIIAASDGGMLSIITINKESHVIDGTTAPTIKETVSKKQKTWA